MLCCGICTVMHIYRDTNLSYCGCICVHMHMYTYASTCMHFLSACPNPARCRTPWVLHPCQGRCMCAECQCTCFVTLRDTADRGGYKFAMKRLFIFRQRNKHTKFFNNWLRPLLRIVRASTCCCLICVCLCVVMWVCARALLYLYRSYVHTHTK